MMDAADALSHTNNSEECSPGQHYLERADGTMLLLIPMDEFLPGVTIEQTEYAQDEVVEVSVKAFQADPDREE
jgi:hypothetical protein